MAMAPQCSLQEILSLSGEKGVAIPLSHYVLPALLQKLVGDLFFFSQGHFVGKLAGI